jgi:hypothetical protein
LTKRTKQSKITSIANATGEAKVKIKVHAFHLRDECGDEQIVIANETNDNICIGGFTANGRYHQFDSTEAYHLGAWIRSNKLPFQYTSQEIEIDVPEPKTWY